MRFGGGSEAGVDAAQARFTFDPFGVEFDPTATKKIQGYLARKRSPLGPYCRPVPRVVGESYGGGRLLIGEVPL